MNWGNPPYLKDMHADAHACGSADTAALPRSGHNVRKGQPRSVPALSVPDAVPLASEPRVAAVTQHKGHRCACAVSGSTSSRRESPRLTSQACPASTCPPTDGGIATSRRLKVQVNLLFS